MQAKVATKDDTADFRKILTDFNEKLINIYTNKTRHIEIENKLNDLSGTFKLLSKKDCNFFLGSIFHRRWWFSKYVYQQAFSKLKLEKDKWINYILN